MGWDLNAGLFYEHRFAMLIIFGLPKITEYEYEYYLAFGKLPNTNMNNIRSEYRTEYEYMQYNAMNTYNNICSSEYENYYKTVALQLLKSESMPWKVNHFLLLGTKSQQ